MIKKAVIDQIVDGKKAVILVGEEETVHIMDVEQLPAGAKEGDWLKVEEAVEQIKVLNLDEEETKKVKERIKNKLEKLRLRGRGI